MPLLFCALPDEAPPRSAALDRGKYWRTLTALSILCTQPALFETLTIRLLTKLDLVCTGSSKSSDTEPAAAYAHAILTTLADTLQIKIIRGDTDVPKFIDRLTPRLYNLFISGALMDPDNLQIPTQNPKVLKAAARVINIIVRPLPLGSVTPVDFHFHCFYTNTGDKKVLLRRC